MSAAAPLALEIADFISGKNSLSLKVPVIPTGLSRANATCVHEAVTSDMVGMGMRVNSI